MIEDTAIPVPVLEGDPPQPYRDAATEILDWPDGPSVAPVLTLARTLWSLYRACKRENVVRAVRRAREHPHGLAALKVRHQILHQLSPEYQTDAVWHSCMTVLDRLVAVPKDLPPDD